jgi:flagellar basal-body rod modification protein FlgD
VDAAGAPVQASMSRLARVEEVIFQEGEIIFGLDGGEQVSSVTVRSAS